MVYSEQREALSTSGSSQRSSCQLKRKVLQQHSVSSAEGTTWSRRGARSTSSMYSSSSAYSDTSSQENCGKRPKLQFSHDRQHYNNKESQQQSQYQLPKLGDQNEYVPQQDLSLSLYSSHISSTKDSKEEFKMMVQSPSSDNCSSFSVRSNSTNNSLMMQQQQPQEVVPHQPQNQMPSTEMTSQYPLENVPFNMMNSGEANPSGFAPIHPQTVTSHAPTAQVVQVATVPLTSVMAIQPVVTSHLVQLNNSTNEVMIGCTDLCSFY